MAERDYDNFVYLTISIPKNSDLHKALKADAKKCGTKQLPKLAGIRLGDYYLSSGQRVAPQLQNALVEEVVVEIDDEALKLALDNANAASDEWPE